MKINPIKIKTSKGIRLIGPGQPAFIIAEMSGNHNQSFNKAKEIINAAANAGADAIKLQTYTADTMTIDCDNKYFQVKVNRAWKGQTLYNLYKKAYTPWEWQAKLKKYGEAKGLLVFSTPFDNTAVDFLKKINVELYKIASFEIVDIPLLEKIGKTKKPVIMSRGMATLSEIKLAVKILKKNGCPQVAILHCVSGYPAKAQEMNLSTIPDIVKKFKVVAGLSDHILNTTVSIAAAALGASIIEKHLTIKRSDGGPDAAFSLEPQELKDMIKAVHQIELAIGKPNYNITKSEAENIIFRRSLFAVKNIKKGEKFTSVNVRSIRPACGLAPKYYKKVIGSIAAKDIERGTPLAKKLIKNTYGKIFSKKSK